MNQPQWEQRRLTLGPLQTIVIEPKDSAPTHWITLCHGFGAPGDDLAGLAEWFLETIPESSGIVPTLIFPAAPISLASEGFGDGRAWWPLSIQHLIDSFASGEYEIIREHVPEGIDQARTQLLECLDAAKKHVGLPLDRLALGGFSQGAMLAIDTALRGLDTPPQALWLYSGCLLCESLWKPNVDRLASTKIVQSHGAYDPILPLAAGQWLRDLLVAGGNMVEFIEFAGPHTIPPAAIEASVRSLI